MDFNLAIDGGSGVFFSACATNDPVVRVAPAATVPACKKRRRETMGPPKKVQTGHYSHSLPRPAPAFPHRTQLHQVYARRDSPGSSKLGINAAIFSRLA
jgi:hypothetical protein